MWEMCLPLLSPRWAPPDLWGHRAQIRAKDEAGITALSDALGSGDALKTKINSALNAQGLDESTGVTAPTKVVIDVSSAGATQSPSWALVLLVASVAAAF